MLKIEIKADNGTVIRPLTNKDCDAVVSFYLSENKIETEVIGITNMEFLKTVSKEITKCLNKLIKDNTPKIEKVKKGDNK